ncbi:hypothetical protein WJX74_007450 [Apatococcus lobatus]|uniref:tRNA (guanine(9)-N(1))-methyltransferase n=1 Tax=Apatococcus lobatus TaxID=904363 RepID=A0AAW1SGT7_9CHLO
MASAEAGERLADTPAAVKLQDGSGASKTPEAEEVCNSDFEATEPAPLSKNAQKKLLKRQRYEDKKAARKASAKQEKHQATEQKKQDVQSLLEGMTEEEKAAWKEERKHVRSARKAQTQEKRSRLQQAMETGQTIVLDLSSAHLMSDLELKSMCQQIAHSYSYNVRATTPCSLHLCSFQGRMKDVLEKQIGGFENWLIHQHALAYDEVFREQKDKVVYLTADSKTTLEELQPDEVYVIGGLVDRNRFASMCLDQATAKGIRTARLPIAEYVKLTGSRVLTVNHVVDILIKWVGSHDWKAALLDSIPARKRTALEANCEGTEDSPEDALNRGSPNADGTSVVGL